MIYLYKSEIPDNKPIFFALSSIYGIGEITSKKICKILGFSSNLRAKDLTKSQIKQIRRLIKSLNLKISNSLKKSRIVNLKKLVSIKSYRGLKRIQGLPIRGQRTHTNAKTAKKRRLKFKTKNKVFIN